MRTLGERGDTRRRMLVLIAGLALSFSVVGARLADLNLDAPQIRTGTAGGAGERTARPDIVDRNGVILATDIQTASLHANARKVIDVDEAIEQITTVLPGLDRKVLRDKLESRKAFVWIKRELSPREQIAVHNLGIPGFEFSSETRRVYPLGRLAAHVLGYVNVDNRGASGIERYIDAERLAGTRRGRTSSPLAPVRLSIDVRVQNVLDEELAAAIAAHGAKAGAGVILDVRTGEVVALASMPDFNPNEPAEALDPKRFNRISGALFEPGSTLKAVTVAMALDEGIATLDTRYDATNPLRIGSSTISDFHGQKRPLTLREVFTYSSNIGAGKIAMEAGIERHKAFLRRLGLLSSLKTELPGAPAPSAPRNWRTLNSVTIAFGHGISMTPLHLAAAGAALMNGGLLIPPTFLRRSADFARPLARRVIKPETSEKMRTLMRLNVETGTGRKAQVAGYSIGGKTGTAEKVVNGRYSKKDLRTSFLGVVPADAPKYVTLVMLDEPRPSAATRGQATAGWNAAPLTGRLISRIAPLLGILPDIDATQTASVKETAN